MMRRLLLILLLCVVPLAHADFLSFGSKKPSFLPADQAFALSVHAVDQHTLIASFKITPSYYLYRGKISFSAADGKTRIVRIDLPKGETKNDPNFGILEVYHQSFQAEDRSGQGRCDQAAGPERELSGMQRQWLVLSAHREDAQHRIRTNNQCSYCPRSNSISRPRQ